MTNVSSRDLSGIDIARTALKAARAAAKAHPSEPAAKRKKRRLGNAPVTSHREPVGLAGVFTQMLADSGWDVSAASGDLLADWPTIAPELADAVVAEHYDQTTGCLHLRPASSNYATHLNLLQQQLVKRINAKLGRDLVRSLRILTPGRGHAPAALLEPARPTPQPEQQRRSGAPIPAHLTAWLDQAATHRAAAESEAARQRDAARSILPPYSGPPLRETDDHWAPLRDHALAVEGLAPGEEQPQSEAERIADRSRREHEAALATARRNRRSTACPGDPVPLHAALRVA